MTGKTYRERLDDVRYVSGTVWEDTAYLIVSEADAELAACRLRIAELEKDAVMTGEDIQEIVTAAVHDGRLSWVGFRKDDSGKYTIPLLSLIHYQLARAILAALNSKKEST